MFSLFVYGIMNRQQWFDSFNFFIQVMRVCVIHIREQIVKDEVGMIISICLYLLSISNHSALILNFLPQSSISPWLHSIFGSAIAIHQQAKD